MLLANDDPNNQLGTGTKTATKLTDPQNGTLTFNADGSFTYTPSTGFEGTDSFTYRMSRSGSSQQSNAATVTITVMNNAPVAVNDSYTTSEDTPLTVTAANGLLQNDTDADGDALTAEFVGEPLHGEVANIEDVFMAYRPDPDYSTLPGNQVGGDWHSDFITYRAFDGLGRRRRVLRGGRVGAAVRGTAGPDGGCGAVCAS